MKRLAMVLTLCIAVAVCGGPTTGGGFYIYEPDDSVGRITGKTLANVGVGLLYATAYTAYFGLQAMAQCGCACFRR